MLIWMKTIGRYVNEDTQIWWVALQENRTHSRRGWREVGVREGFAYY